MTEAGANKIFVASALAPALQKYLKKLQLLQNWLAPWLHTLAPQPCLQGPRLKFYGIWCMVCPRAKVLLYLSSKC